MSEVTVERRGVARCSIAVPASVAVRDESACPPGQTVDLSPTGVLVRLADAGRPPCPGDPVVVSLVLADGALHVLGSAQRSLRGEDGQWYVAVEFGELHPEDSRRLLGLIDSGASESNQL